MARGKLAWVEGGGGSQGEQESEKEERLSDQV